MSPSGIGLVTLGVALVAIVGAIAVGRDQRVEDAATVTAKVYGFRRVYAGLLAALLALTAAGTLRALPYAEQTPAVTVQATASMWSWSFEGVGEGLPAGQLVAFEVTATDVTHGFGIYDADGHLLAQTQAMPGRTNTLYYTFEAPGTYHVLCLEYCGIAHHVMLSRLEVR